IQPDMRNQRGVPGDMQAIVAAGLPMQDRGQRGGGHVATIPSDGAAGGLARLVFAAGRQPRGSKTDPEIRPPHRPQHEPRAAQKYHRGGKRDDNDQREMPCHKPPLVAHSTPSTKSPESTVPLITATDFSP